MHWGCSSRGSGGELKMASRGSTIGRQTWQLGTVDTRQHITCLIAALWGTKLQKPPEQPVAVVWGSRPLGRVMPDTTPAVATSLQPL